MAQLINGDCLEEMKNLNDNSIDFIFCDLPYNQTSCKWDKEIIDLEKFWKEIMRVKKLHTPIFMTTTTKFGVSLINSAPKKCPFRWDLVWVKSSPCGHLSARKFPMRKHEMVYAFYEKLPLYDISSHTHKFIKMSGDRKGKCYKDGAEKKETPQGSYEPPLPVSVVDVEEKNIYNDSPSNEKEYRKAGRSNGAKTYEPPLPVSVVDVEHDWVKSKENNCYGGVPTENNKECGGHKQRYEPPLPVSVVDVEDEKYIPPQMRTKSTRSKNSCYGSLKYETNTKYEPPLPNSLLHIKSTKGKHSTEKPVALMEYLLKYFSKEGDIVLDPTMGSGSTGVACKNMNRDFIGIEKDSEIFDVACERVYG